MSKAFIDKLRIYVKAGSGAAGNPAVRGKGGDGGNVFLQVTNGQTLSKLLKMCPKKRFKAQHGMATNKRIVIGQNGKDLIIPVPAGISVRLDMQQSNQPTAFAAPKVSTTINTGDATTKLLGHLDNPDQKLLVAKGGIGGVSQTGYMGTVGQSNLLILDLKLMSDYGLVGFPNAGKSSLLKAVSGEPVKIASYPFTTLRPKIAYCKYPDHRQISLTDLPGLADLYAQYSVHMTQPCDATTDTDNINSDSTGKMLPPLKHTNFLKHVERTSCILIVLDSLGYCNDQYSVKRNPLAITYLVLKTLERWSSGILLDKPMACVLNKIDLPDALDNAKKTKYYLERIQTQEAKEAAELPAELLPKFTPKFEWIELISAAHGTNISELKIKLRNCLDEIAFRKHEQFTQDTSTLTTTMT